MVSEPNFVYTDFVAESVDSPDGDDDKVYLFFSENAMEYDFYSKVVVSRVARVCKVFIEYTIEAITTQAVQTCLCICLNWISL